MIDEWPEDAHLRQSLPPLRDCPNPGRIPESATGFVQSWESFRHVSEQEVAQWERERVQNQPRVTHPQMRAMFMDSLRSQFGEGAETMLGGVWDAGLQAWLFRCPACREHWEDELYRPLIVTRSGWVMCASGCEFVAIMMGVAALPRRREQR